MIDWCDDKYNFWPTNITLSPGKEKWPEGKVFRRVLDVSLKLAWYYMVSRMKKKVKCAPCPYDSVHPLALPSLPMLQPV